MKRQFGRVDVKDEVRSEVAFHFEMTVRELMAGGMTDEQARAEATRRFGNVQSVTEQCEQFGRERDRSEHRAEFRSEFMQDMSFAMRQLARARSFSTIAILTIALGVGATAAVFSALYAVVLRPLPFRQPDRVVTLRPTVKGDELAMSSAEFLELRDHATGFEHVAAALGQYGFTLTDGDVPELIGGGRVTRDYFAVFGVQPIIGRTFNANEDTPGQDHVTILSHRFWISHYNGDENVLGRTIHMNGEAYSIIGVMPASFDIERESDEVWTPLTITAADAARTGAHFLGGVARLRQGVSIGQARDQAAIVLRGLAAKRSNSTIKAPDIGMKVIQIQERIVGDYRSLLFILLGAVSFVLLIACTNVANLLLSRGTSRAKELAIRASLGAGRSRLFRQMLTESLILALVGSAVGLVLAFVIIRGVRAISPPGIPRLELATIDWPVLLFTFVLAIVCAVVFGLLPALRALRPSLQGTLRESGRSSSGATSRDPLRNVLVAAEVALAMTLLTGAGLLIRSAWLVQQVDPGFDPKGVLTARIILPQARYASATSVVQTFARIRDEAARIPGVQYAALGSVAPLSGGAMLSSVKSEGATGANTALDANIRLVSPGYFAVMSIPRLAGRDFNARDDASAPRVTVINAALGRALWPGVKPASLIGKRIDAISNERDVPEYREIVGVIGDLHDDGLGKATEPEFYLPVPQTPELLWQFIQRSLVVTLKNTNTSVDAASLVKPLKQAIAVVDPSLPLADSKTMNDYLRESLESARFNMLLLSALGAIALVLAMVGVYGVVSYFVTQRTQEIGIRLALGASPRQIWRHVVRRGVTPIIVGIGVGFALSMFTANVLRSQLYGVGTADPGTHGAVGALLLLVSFVATYLPARRAMRVAPIVALNGG